MNETVFSIALIGCIVVLPWAFSWALGKLIDRQLARHLNPPDTAAAAASPTTHEPPPITPAAPARLWHTLPGNVIELGATGYQIHLRASSEQPKHVYHLYSPEGEHLASGMDGTLPQLQDLAERMATSRAEFAGPGQKGSEA